MPLRLEGFIDDGRGEPLADIPAVATILGTSTVVDTTITDDDGHWLFSGLPTTDEYVVTLSDASGNAVSRATWSGEMRELYVRDRLDVDGLPVLLDPAAGNALLWSATGLYAPTAPVTDLTNYYTKTEADALFLTSTEADALFLTPAEGNAAYAATAHNHDTTYVQLTGGSVMTGLLGPTSNNTRDLGTTALRWRKLWAVDAEFTNAPTVGGAALLTATAADALFLTPAEGNTAYATAAHNHDATYVQLTGGSVMTGLLGPSTHNTRDLGTTGTRWRALYGMTADFTTSLTVATKPLVISPDGANIVEWRANGLYAAAGAVTDIWVNTTGDTMTGDLNMTANVLPTVTNVRSLGSTSLRWLKVWATDADFTNAPTVGGSALLTATAADALFLTPAEGNAAYATSAHAHAAAYVDVGGDTMTGPLVLPLGLVGTPSLTFGDPDTGLYATATGKLAITINGVQKLLIQDTLPNLSASGGLTVQGALGAQNGLVVLNGLDVQTGASTFIGGAFSAALTVGTTLSVNSRPVIMAGCRVYHNANQTITTGTGTALAFNSERYDTDGFHDPVTLNTRLTVPTGHAGKYLITATIDWGLVADATWRLFQLRLNGTIIIARVSQMNTNSGTAGLAQHVSCTYDLADGNYVELLVRHDRGSNLDVLTAANYSPEFSLQRVG